MKLTKKSVKHEVETTETVCEITQEEFDTICSKTAAATVMSIIGDDPTVEDVAAGVAMTTVLAKFVNNLDKQLFNDKNETHDKKEEN